MGGDAEHSKDPASASGRGGEAGDDLAALDARLIAEAAARFGSAEGVLGAFHRWAGLTEQASRRFLPPGTDAVVAERVAQAFDSLIGARARAFTELRAKLSALDMAERGALRVPERSRAVLALLGSILADLSAMELAAPGPAAPEPHTAPAADPLRQALEEAEGPAGGNHLHASIRTADAMRRLALATEEEDVRAEATAEEARSLRLVATSPAANLYDLGAKLAVLLRELTREEAERSGADEPSPAPLRLLLAADILADATVLANTAAPASSCPENPSSGTIRSGS